RCPAPLQQSCLALLSQLVRRRQVKAFGELFDLNLDCQLHTYRIVTLYEALLPLQTEFRAGALRDVNHIS
ncbi:MAG: hypothetical protein WB676_31730, partial [Bryobacteraceae bacterium]